MNYKKNDALVSIIMPSYNTGTFVGESINSVIAQTYQNWELIIVDDCSLDNSVDVIKSFLNDKRIRLYVNRKNLGAAKSRNFAIRQAKGKWIAFLDSDDLWKPCKLARQIEYMEKNGYYFSYTGYYEMNENGELNGNAIKGPKKITRNGFLRYCWPGCLTVMYDKEYIGQVQIVNIKKNNDYAMWLAVSKKATCYLLDEYLAVYRRGRRGSISSHSIIELLKWHFLLFREAEKQCFVFAVVSTLRNVFFGFVKKITYVKRKIKI